MISLTKKIMFKRTRSLSNAICNTHKIFLSEYVWMTKKFRVKWSHNSTCIFSHIEDNGPNILVSRPWPVRSRDVSCHMTTWFPRYHFLSIVTESLSLTISEIIWHFLYLGHDLDLSGSRDAIGHVTIWFLRCHFLKVLYCNRVSISNHFRDNGHFLYMGHDLDLSMSCDVISHVTIWFPKCHFL